MHRGVLSAYSSQSPADRAALHLIEQIGIEAPTAIVFFVAPTLDGSLLARSLRRKYPNTEVIGCSTAGEFTGTEYGTHGVSALALWSSKVPRCAGAMAPFDTSVVHGIETASQRIANKLGIHLRDSN